MASTPKGSSILQCASLDNFFIFTPKNVAEGKEYEKLLFFYPPEEPIETQTKYVGLSEALVNFTSKFSPDKPCEVVHYEKHTSVMLSPETDFWMVLKVNNPTVTKLKDGNTVVEFKENDLDDIALQTIISHIYQLYKMFNGKFSSTQSRIGEEGLKKKLASFYLQYIPTVKFDQVDLFNTLDGVHFLPVDRNVYLRIQGFIHLIESTFPLISHSCFLYNDHLVWSGLEQDDMRVLYRYITSYLLPAIRDTNSSSALISTEGSKSMTVNQSMTRTFIKVNTNSQSGFITGPEVLSNDAASTSELPVLYIGHKEESLGLLIYQFDSIMCIFLVSFSPNQSIGSHRDNNADPQCSLDSSFYKNIGSFISNQVSFLAPILDEHYQKKQGSEEQYRYVYFNHMNLALKTSFKEKGAVIPREIMNMLNSIHSDFEKSTEDVSEVLIRTHNDKWIVGRKSDQREFFVIFDHKNSHLIEINEEVKKLSSTCFNNIFID